MASTGQFLHGSKDLRIEARNLTPPGPGEVQVAIRSTTLCGSDLHYYSHYRNGSILVQEPLCLGHESAGEVVALGDGVHQKSPNIKIGDLVVLEVGVPCNTCEFCVIGRYNICPYLRFRSSGSKFPHYQGTLQELVNHPAAWVHPLHPNLDCEIGALLEPLAVAVQAVRRAKLHNPSYPFSNVLIFGAGAVGLLVATAAQAAGARNVVMADIHQGRLDFAKEKGFASATFTVPMKRAGDSIEDVMSLAKSTAEAIGNVSWPNGEPVGKANVVFECTGVASCVQCSVYAAKSGGCVVIAGLGTPNITLPISEATAREITMVPTWRYADTYREAMSLAEESVCGFSTGRKLPDISHLITHRFKGLDAVPAAFKVAGAPVDEEGKLVIKTAVNFPG